MIEDPFTDWWNEERGREIGAVEGDDLEDNDDKHDTE